MLVSHFLDLMPIWVLLIGTILLMTIFIEFGFRLGKSAQLNAKKAQTDIHYTRVINAGLTCSQLRLPYTGLPDA